VRRIMRLAAISLAAGALALTSAGTAGAASPTNGKVTDQHAAYAASGPYQGCPYGAVCIYPHADWNGGHPSLVFWSYGVHRISGQYGKKRFFNNQYGWASAHMCTDSNGKDCTNGQLPQTYEDYDFTPINSILLAR